MRRLSFRARMSIGLVVPIVAVVAVAGDLLWSARQARIGAWTGAAAVTVIVLATLVGALAIRRIGRRIDRVVAMARDVEVGRNVLQVPRPENDEFDRVTRALDALARRLSRREAQMALLRELSELLQASRDRREACAVAARVGRRLFPRGSGTIYLVDRARDSLRSVAGWGRGAGLDPPDVFAPADCWSLRRGRPHKVDASTTDVPCAHVVEHVAEPAHLCLPMVAHGEAIGVLSVALGREEDDGESVTISPNRERLALTVAEQLSLTLANLRLQADLREQSVRDPLTGLFNRRYLESALEQAFRRAERDRRSLAVVLLDLDHFKRINDGYGHEAGDAVLGDVAAALESGLRRGDVACRWGGEEFVVILPETGESGALAVARKIQSRIRGLPLRFGDREIGRMTASFGVAWFPGAASEAPGLLRAADVAMYRAKQAGRDRIELAGSNAA